MRAAIYCRVSTRGQEDNYSLESQLAQCRAYAQSHGYTVAEQHIYRDVASGFTLDRPQVTILRAALRAGEIDAVICNSFDRLASDTKDLYRLYDDLEAGQAALVSVSQGTFKDTPEGQMVMLAYTMGRQLWRKDHKERTSRGRLARAKSGKLVPGRKAAYGYKWRAIDGDAHAAYERDPLTAPILERIYQHFVSGGSLHSARNVLEAEGIPSPLGGTRWSLSTISRLVSNPRYKGEPEMFQSTNVARERNDPGPRRRAIPESGRVKLPEGVVPALVSPDVWERANVQLAAGHSNNTRRGLEPEAYLLRGGFVQCPHCGYGLGTYSPKNGRRAYRLSAHRTRYHGCPRASIDAEKLDRDVWAMVEQIIKHPNRILDKITADVASQHDPTEPERLALQKALQTIERAQRMQALAIEALESPEAAAPNLQRLKQLAKEHQALTEQLEEVNRRQEGWASGRAAAERLVEMFYAEQARLDNLSYAEKRHILAWLGVSVKLWPQGTEPRWTLTTTVQLPRWIDAEPAIDDAGAPVVPGQRYRTSGGFPEADHPKMTELLKGAAGEAASQLKLHSPN
jgi:site-specific DNA recombinase